ncbi:MAG: glycosyltransferase family 39 protein [Actinobacteria bacterium]|nr:MAG: glycosyltransferase family 39 protein [Actinomycetota bacterium]
MMREDRFWKRFAVISIGVGAVVRILFGLWLHPPLNYVYSDAQGYVTRAARLASGTTLNRFDTFFPPGTHILLALPLRIFGTGRAGLWAASVLWLILSCSVPLLAWRVAARVMTPKAAAITAALCAVWPLFIAYGGFFMSEIPSVVILLATILLAFRVRETAGPKRVAYALAAGVSAGAALVVRPQLVLNVAIAAITMLAVRRSFRVAGAAAAGLLIALAPALALNAHAAGRFVGLSENGGLNFFQGHCPARGVKTIKVGVGVLEFASSVVAQQDRGRDYLFVGHIAWEQSFFFHQGLDCIRKDGIGHVAVLARNVADLGITSVPWPPSNEQTLRWFVRPANLAYRMLPSLVVGGVALSRSNRRGTNRPLLFVAHLVCVLPTAVLFYGDPRFRIPYDVFGLGLFAMLLTSALPFRRAEPSGMP